MTQPAPQPPAKGVAAIGRYAKAITALLGVALTGATAVYGASNKWVTLAIGVGSVLGVYAVPNRAP